MRYCCITRYNPFHASLVHPPCTVFFYCFLLLFCVLLLSHCCSFTFSRRLIHSAKQPQKNHTTITVEAPPASLQNAQVYGWGDPWLWAPRWCALFFSFVVDRVLSLYALRINTRRFINKLYFLYAFLSSYVSP